MRLLILTPWFPNHQYSQQGNFILDSVKSLVDMGHEVIVLVTRAWKPKKENIIQLQNVPVYHCRYFSIPRHYLSPISFWFYKKTVGKFLKKIISQHQIQLIHAHTEYAGMAAVNIGKELGLPTVLTIHGVSTDKKLYSGITRKQLFEYPLNQSNRIVLVGSSLISFASQFVKCKNHLQVIANGFRSSLQNSLEIKKTWCDENLRFISVSNLEEGKGIDINLKALAKLNEIGIHNWSYKIVGNGSQRKYLETLSQELGLIKQIKFLGAINHDEVFEHLSTADIFILPSYREAFGVSYLEAMSCGLLAIGVEGQGPEDFIEHGKTGFLVRPQSVDSLFDAIKYLFPQKDLIKKIAASGMVHVHRHFTWEQHALQLTHLYQNLKNEKCLVK